MYKRQGLPCFVRSLGTASVTLSKPFPQLRACHVKRGEADVFMVTNESMSAPFDGEISLSVTGDGVQVDLLLDEISRITGCRIHLRLECGQSTLLVFGEPIENLREKTAYTEEAELQLPWALSLSLIHI